MPAIHENTTPPERPGHDLHTISLKGMERGQIDAWLSKRSISEAWIYDSPVGRVMSWYTPKVEER